MDKLQKIRAVAFDLDGTLVDSAPGLTWAVDNALYALELPGRVRRKPRFAPPRASRRKLTLFRKKNSAA
ncbi:Phosphoglycolate phosphatase [Cronobacter malonaticus 507]|nr:Phosphoglycolate phosphatase [Cronobacter malonaticus 507]